MIAHDSDGKFLDYAWPGGYPVYHTCADGGTLCPACANDPTNPVKTGKLHEAMGRSPDAAWTIVGSEINYEDPDLFCDHCNKRIESAYAEDVA
jgi:hypothetical protein